jgi:hypothetical protein
MGSLSFLRGSGAVSWLGLGVLAAMPALLNASPAAYPQRYIQPHRVNLTSLISWWDHPQGQRPLTSWKHIRGHLERETPYGWLLQATVEGQAGSRYLLLRNPPRKELARFRELEKQVANLEQRRADVLHFANLPAFDGWTVDGAGDLVPVRSVNFDRVEQAHADLADLDYDIAVAHEEMAAMVTKDGWFRVECFALRLNETYQGSPMYDFGNPSW